MKRLTNLIALFCVIVVPWSMSLFGQEEEEDEIIELESFDVLEDDERRGYQSNLIIGANRMVVPIDEMDCSAFVINSKMLKDLNPHYIIYATKFVAGVEQPRFYFVRDNPVIRSNETATTLVDGFPIRGLNYIPVSLLEQVEVIKGSQGVLYGTVSAGGILNRVLKAPQFEAAGALNVEIGSYDFYS